MELNKINEEIKGDIPQMMMPTVEIDWLSLGKFIGYYGEEKAADLLSQDVFQKEYAVDMINLWKRKNGK